MKNLFKISFFLLLISLWLLSGCQRNLNDTIFPPTLTLIPASQTPSATQTAIASETPTPSPTPTITPSPTLVYLTVPAGPVQVPILLYHHVSAEIHYNRYNVDPAVFDDQMKWLSDNGYRTMNVSDLANVILAGGQIPLRPVLITFDDGDMDVYQNAFPILKKYGFTATFYVVNDYIGGKDMVTINELTDLIQNGWEIGSHSSNHLSLTAQGVDINTEIHGSKVELQNKLGVTINSFAYPFGEINPEVVTRTINFGYSSAVGLGESIMHDRWSLFYLTRIEIQNAYSMDKFISYFPWQNP